MELIKETRLKLRYIEVNNKLIYKLLPYLCLTSSNLIKLKGGLKND